MKSIVKSIQTIVVLLLLTILMSCGINNTQSSNDQSKKISMDDKLILALRFETKEGQKELFKKELHTLLEKLAQRPNFISVTFHEDIDDPQAIVLYEVWEKETKDGFMQKNFADSNFNTYQVNVKNLLAKPPTVYFLKAYKEL